MSLPVVGLVSSFREGNLVHAAVSSLLEVCSRVYVLEGPVGLPGESSGIGEESRFPKGNVFVRPGDYYDTDALKRTALLRFAQKQTRGPAWGIVLDGDEVLLWPELLRDYLDRSEATDPNGGGMKVKLVFEDGQVYETGARVLRLDRVESYVLSSHILKLHGVETVWTSPLVPAERAPFQGEPHILHRGYLRPPGRNVPEMRMSTYELDALAGLGIDIGAGRTA